MYSRVLLLLAVALGASTQRPSYYNQNPVNRDTDTHHRFSYFDLELLRIFDTNENNVISPASIKAVLGMILEGAGGSTAEEIGRALRIQVDSPQSRSRLPYAFLELIGRQGQTIVESANAAFISNQYEINPAYDKVLRENYKAQIRSVDFSNGILAANLINSWASNTTRGLIPELISPEYFSGDVSVIITNALYFKGLWKNQFEEKSTSIKCFHTARGCKNVYMMKIIDNFNYKYISEIASQVIELPYMDDKYSMLVVLPNEKQSMGVLIEDIQHQPFSTIVDKLEPNEVLVNLPRFEIEHSSDLVGQLKSMGIDKVFGPYSNLSGIVRRGHTKISNIIHKAKLVVNEKGSEAGAGTGAVVIPLMGSPTPHFIADRPFLVFIYNVDTKDILFEAIVNSPTEAHSTTQGYNPKPTNQNPQTVPQYNANPKPTRTNVQNIQRPVVQPVLREPQPVQQPSYNPVVADPLTVNRQTVQPVYYVDSGLPKIPLYVNEQPPKVPGIQFTYNNQRN